MRLSKMATDTRVSDLEKRHLDDIAAPEKAKRVVVLERATVRRKSEVADNQTSDRKKQAQRHRFSLCKQT